MKTAVKRPCRPCLLLAACATMDTADWPRTIILKLPAWKRIELSTCAGDHILGAHMMLLLLITPHTVMKDF